MTLNKFVKEFVLPNTLVRLWVADTGGFKQIGEGESLFMEHDIPRGIYANRNVVGLKDILVIDSNYKEAVNIVIK